MESFHLFKPRSTPRTSAEMDQVLAEVKKAWILNPHMRLGQLLMNCTVSGDVFGTEDAELVFCMDRMMKRMPPSAGGQG